MVPDPDVLRTNKDRAWTRRPPLRYANRSRALVPQIMEEADAYSPPGMPLPNVAHDSVTASLYRVYRKDVYCPQSRAFSFDELAVPDELPVIHIPRVRRFVCSKYGSRKVAIRSEWPDGKPTGPFYSPSMSDHPKRHGSCRPARSASAALRSSRARAPGPTRFCLGGVPAGRACVANSIGVQMLQSGRLPCPRDALVPQFAGASSSGQQTSAGVKNRSTLRSTRPILYPCLHHRA